MASSDFVQNASSNGLPPNMLPQHGFYPIQSSFRPLNSVPPIPYFRHQPPAATTSTLTPSSSSSTTISLNRSQRCGVCAGCKRKACGQCNYCMDSPQFGGPGVKKQSCIERRCLRVLENRLQRDTPGFKARIGCGNCEDCRTPDCQCCLVCMDKKFFGNKFIPGALCAKKRCNNATNSEINDRAQPIKRSCDWAALDYGGPTKKLSLETRPLVFHAPQFPNFVQKLPEPMDKQMIPNMIHQPPSSLLMPVPTAVPQMEFHQNTEMQRPIDIAPTLKYIEPNHSICSSNEFYSFPLTSSIPDFNFSDPIDGPSELPARVEEKFESEPDFKTNFDDPFQPPSYVMQNTVVLQQL